jgi:phosphoglycerate kinase
MTLKSIDQFPNELSGKTVLVRANFDVPLEGGQVVDTTRLDDCLDTIHFLLPLTLKIILIAHQDRPDGHYTLEASLQPVADYLSQKLSEPVPLVPFKEDYTQTEIPENRLCLLENLRFWAAEESPDEPFTTWLSSLADVYVNEAFANCHRNHASITHIAHVLPAFAGLNLAKEIKVLHQVVSDPKRPLVLVVGGAKIETKKPLINKFLPLADTILVGGKIATEIKEGEFTDPKIKIASLIPDTKDITEGSAQEFAQVIQAAGTVIWNGSMGMFEDPSYEQGTTIVAQSINTTPAFTVVGGGDTETALTQLNLESGIDHISSGGGAMLTFLSEGDLVGLESLKL